MPKPQGKCIFCEGTGLSKEHVFPDWLKPYVPRTLDYTTTQGGVFHKDHADLEETRQTGDPHSRRLRVVCKTCNTGWMSRLQETAKPILLPLIQGQSRQISRHAQNLLATWVSMFTSVAEYHEPSKVVISQAERRFIMDQQRTPERWKIWISHYERGKWRGHWSHTVWPFYLRKKDIPDVPANTVPRPNTQTTTIVVGQLYVHVLSSEIPEALDLFNFEEPAASKLCQLWPTTNNFRWPRGTLNDLDALYVSEGYFRYIGKLTGLDAIT